MDENTDKTEDEIDDDTDDLTPEEKEEKTYQDMVSMSDEILNRWTEGRDEGARQSVIDSYIETGDLDHTIAGVDEIETGIVQSAFMLHTEREILKPLGLKLGTWQSYMDEADLPAFRKAVVAGDWGLLRDHAQRVASHIHQNGDSNA